MSCCPPNAEKYLAATYETVGKSCCLPNGHELYSTGPADSAKAVILIPDVYGWNGGRTRKVADWFGEAGYVTAVPKLMVPPLEGGTDGDGLYPNFDFATDGAKFPGFMQSIGWEDILKPRIESTLKYVQSLGATTVHLVGFCWGGWVGSKILASDLAENFKCLAIPHPSLALEQRVYGGEVMELVKRVQRPVFFMPAKGDNDEYREGGEWYLDLKARFPSSQTLDFPHMNHGFVPRGDISDPDTHAAVLLALTSIHAFFKAHEKE